MCVCVHKIYLTIFNILVCIGIYNIRLLYFTHRVYDHITRVRRFFFVVVLFKLKDAQFFLNYLSVIHYLRIIVIIKKQTIIPFIKIKVNGFIIGIEFNIDIKLWLYQWYIYTGRKYDYN